MLEVKSPSITYNYDTDTNTLTTVSVVFQGNDPNRESLNGRITLTATDLDEGASLDASTHDQLVLAARKKAAGYINPADTPELTIKFDSISYSLDQTSSNTIAIFIALRGYNTDGQSLDASVKLTADDLAEGTTSLDDLSRKQAEALARKKGAGYINPTAKTAEAGQAQA